MIFALQDKLTDGEFKSTLDLTMECYKLAEGIKAERGDQVACRCTNNEFLCTELTSFLVCPHKAAILEVAPLLPIYMHLSNGRLVARPQALNLNLVPNFDVVPEDRRTLVRKSLMFIVKILNGSNGMLRMSLFMVIIDMMFKNFYVVQHMMAPVFRSSFVTALRAYTSAAWETHVNDNWSRINVFLVDRPNVHVYKNLVGECIDLLEQAVGEEGQRAVVPIQHHGRRQVSPRGARQPHPPPQRLRPQLQAHLQQAQVPPQARPAEEPRPQQQGGQCRFVYLSSSRNAEGDLVPAGTRCVHAGLQNHLGYCNSHKKFKGRVRPNDAPLGG